ncbi:MAG TPA: DPP IV N-terminal domain-containing protein [Longimicrobiales bacterium]|nr:DPP IV N-terminal domain-containing protein [Longimicrobiales bacterium]
MHCVRALLCVLAAACGGDAPTQPTPPALVVEATGRAERGLVLVLSARTAGSGGSLSGVTWTVEPAGAASVDADGHAQLLREGTVVFRATSGESTGTLSVDVALPPFILVEALSGEGTRTLFQVRLDGTELSAVAVGAGEVRGAAMARGALVFVGYRTGNAELYRLPAGGGAVERLTTTAAAEGQPALSADGTRLAFTRVVGGVPKLHTARADAGDAARPAPAHGYAGAIESSPTWSPAGDRVAFMSTATGRPGLYIVNVATGSVVTLRADEASYGDPAWSPDGRSIAYAMDDGVQTDLWIHDVATGQATRLTNRPASDGRPVWLADGRLLFTTRTGATERLEWLDLSEPATLHPVPVAVAVFGSAAVR